MILLSMILPIIQKIPFGSHRQPLQWLYSIEKILFAEIEIVRVPIMHPWYFVSGWVSHEVQEKGVFIHHSGVGIRLPCLLN